MYKHDIVMLLSKPSVMVFMVLGMNELQIFFVLQNEVAMIAPIAMRVDPEQFE